MGDKAPYDAGGVPADPAQGVRGEAALPFQADVRQSGMGGRQALPVARLAVAVEGAERAQIAEVGSVAGGQDDRVDLLGGAVGPCRLRAVALFTSCDSDCSPLRQALAPGRVRFPRVVTAPGPLAPD
ncbi:hypothetical protein GCM10010424_28160 [Streptomyces lienomycini]